MESRRDTAEELRRLLSLAEEIQSKYELAARKRSELFAQEAIVAIVGVVVAGALASTLALGPPIGIGIVVGVVGFVALAESLRTRLQRRVNQEERALSEVVSIVREVETAMAHEEDWSPLERAEFRIRLSRFEA